MSAKAKQANTNNTQVKDTVAVNAVEKDVSNNSFTADIERITKQLDDEQVSPIVRDALGKARATVVKQRIKALQAEIKALRLFIPKRTRTKAA